MRSRLITSRNTWEPAVSPWNKRWNASCGNTSKSARSRDRGHRRRGAVDEALVPERLPRARESGADSAAAAVDDLLDGAVDRQVAGGRDRAFVNQRPPGGTPCVATGGQEAPQRERVKGAEGGEPTHVSAVRRPAELEVGERGGRIEEGASGGVLGERVCDGFLAERRRERSDLHAHASTYHGRDAAFDRERRRMAP